MKKFMRKVNRGLVLGGVLVIGVTAYVVADYKRFETEKPEVEQLVREYVDEIEKINITPEAYRENYISYNKEDAESRIREFNGISDKYWIDYDLDVNDLYEYVIVKDDFSYSMKRMLDNENRGYVTEFSIDLKDLKVQKDGPDAAVVTFDEMVHYVGLENSTVITSSGYDDSYSFWDPTNPVEPKFMQTSFSNACSVHLVRKSDGWKIIKSVSESNWDAMVTPVQKSESEGEA